MALLNNYVFPAIKNEDHFEDFCLDFAKVKYVNAQKNGRRGQRQNGVDIFYNTIDENNKIHFYGLQCKAKGENKKLKKNEIEEEINKAKTFTPSIEVFFIMTTAKRDSILQEYIRNKNIELLEENLFSIQLMSWDDIIEEISKDEYFALCEKYFSDFFVNINKKGYSVSKLFSLEIGIENNYDTNYEVMIGKIIKTDSESFSGIYYFQNSYFICDLNHKKMDTFPEHCFPSDLEQVFLFKRDRFIISEWLRKTDIDKILASSNMMEIRISITKEKYIAFLNSLNDDDI